MDFKVSLEALRQRQSLSLTEKIHMSKARIREFYYHYSGKVYVSFSGGKDSTVLLDLVRQEFPDVPAVFMDTGLEYPEIKEFVHTVDNVIWLKPKMSFKEVLDKYGYPVISKEVSKKISEIRHTKSEKLRNKNLYGDEKGNGKMPEKYKYLIDSPIPISDKCCYYLKKQPFHHYEKQSGRKGIVGLRAEDSRLRLLSYRLTGCNSFDSARPVSRPISFWLIKDIWDYITTNQLPYSSIYHTEPTTGCVFCLFGVHLEKEPNRFQRMKLSHPQLYDYCINYLGCGKVMNILGVKYD